MDAALGNLWMISAIAAVVIAVLAVVLVLLRGRGGLSSRRNGRLGIQDYCVIDKTRRLVIVRRDNVEHLLMIGGPQDLVVESGISTEPAVAEKPQMRSFREELEEVGRPPALSPVPIRPAPMPVDRPAPNLRSVSRSEPRLGETGEDTRPGDDPLSEPPLR